MMGRKPEGAQAMPEQIPNSSTKVGSISMLTEEVVADYSKFSASDARAVSRDKSGEERHAVLNNRPLFASGLEAAHRGTAGVNPIPLENRTINPGPDHIAG